jgi:hypothetical protein
MPELYSRLFFDIINTVLILTENRILVTAGHLMFQTQKGTTNDIRIPCFSMVLSQYRKLAAAAGATATITAKGTFEFCDFCCRLDLPSEF